MTPYSTLAALYDRLNGPEVPARCAARLSKLLRSHGVADGLVLDLACGTGAVTEALAREGFEMIGCDRSPDMLNVARARCAALPVPPVWICQEMEHLDLYGTVRAVVSTLDSVNYLDGKRALARAFSRVALFLEKGGIFLFDVKSPALFAEQGGTSSVYEEENGLFCTWQYGLPRAGCAVHQVDLFAPDNGKYMRFTEQHIQHVFTLEELQASLAAAGMPLRRVYRDYTSRLARAEEGRLLLCAEKE